MDGQRCVRRLIKNLAEAEIGIYRLMKLCFCRCLACGFKGHYVLDAGNPAIPNLGIGISVENGCVSFVAQIHCTHRNCWEFDDWDLEIYCWDLDWQKQLMAAILGHQRNETLFQQTDFDQCCKNSTASLQVQLLTPIAYPD